MFTSKIKFLRLMAVDGRRGWNGTLAEWNLAREHELYKFSLQALKDSWKGVWK
jgi:hypothetical protein